jgi:hypothetical protein
MGHSIDAAPDLGDFSEGPTKGISKGSALRLAVRVGVVALFLDLVATLGGSEIQVGRYWEWRGVWYFSGITECHLHVVAWMALLVAAVLAVRAWLHGPRTVCRTVAWAIWAGLLLVLLVFYPLPQLSNGVPIYGRLTWGGPCRLHMYTKGRRLSPAEAARQQSMRAAYQQWLRAQKPAARVPAPQYTKGRPLSPAEAALAESRRAAYLQLHRARTRGAGVPAPPPTAPRSPSAASIKPATGLTKDSSR